MSLPNPSVVRPVPNQWAPPPAVAVEKPVPAPAQGAVDDAGSLLFDNRDEAEALVSKAAANVRPSEGKRKLSEVARKVAHREISRAIVGLLDVKLGNVVLRAWHRHGALLGAAQRTSGGGREVVLLAEHTVSSTHTPHVELAIDGVEIGRVGATIALTLQVIGVNAIVERGSLVALEGGSVVASGKFSVEQMPIASRSRTLDAVAMIHLDHPIRLAVLPDAEEPSR